MQQKRYTDEQIIGFLKAHEAGAKISDLVREHGFSEQSFCRWKSTFGGMEVSDAKRLKELESENNRLADSRRIRVLNVVDDYSRVCVSQLVDLSISGARTARFLSQLGEVRGLPKRIVMDNGPELTSKAMFIWSQQTMKKRPKLGISLTESG